MVGADPRQWRSWYRNTLRKSRRKFMSGNGKDKGKGCGLVGGKGQGGQNPHWEVQLDVVNECGKGQTRKVVWIGRIAKLKIDALMGKFKNQEWFAYLLGEDWRIKDLYLPEQMASSAFVGNIENDEYNKLPVIGAIHSHHNMSIDMSSHDHDFVNSNHNISLLVQRNNQGQRITGQVRLKVPCGALYITDADVRLDLEVEFDKKKFMDEIDERINKRKQQQQRTFGTTFHVDRPGFVPDYMRTFPSHHQGCSCTECQKDRRKYLNKQRRQTSGASTWDTGEEVKSADVEFEGAWICEECSKINYQDKDEELMKECVWCQSPRKDVDSVWEDEDEDEMNMREEIEKFQSIGENPEVVKALQERHNETLDYLTDETVLENCIDKVSRYLLILKTVLPPTTGEGAYKKQLDEFAGILALDYDEKEDDVLNEIVDRIALIEQELDDETEEENTETEEENSEEESSNS